MGKIAQAADFKRSIQNFNAEFDRLAQDHYGISADEIIQNLDDSKQKLRYMRLLGVIIKEPFAEERDIDPKFTDTGARKGLEWKPEEELRHVSEETWQFEFIRALVKEEGLGSSREEVFNYVFSYGYQEKSLGKVTLSVLRRYICKREDLPPELVKALDEAKKKGVEVSDPTVAGISVGTAATVAAGLGLLLPPTLAVTAAPLLAGLALLIIRVGLDVFCEWSKNLNSLRDEEEKTEIG